MVLRYTGIKSISGSMLTTLANAVLSATGSASLPSYTGTMNVSLANAVMNASGSVGGVGAGTEILTMSIEDFAGSSRTNVPITFGQVFLQGDLPSGQVVRAKVDSTYVSSQCDIKSVYSDGSAKHVIISCILPSSNGSQTHTVVLETVASPGGSAITKTAITNTGFDAVVSCVVGASTYSLSARSLLLGTITPLKDVTHLSGPVVSEYIVGGPLKLNGTGSDHAQLAAYFHVRMFSNNQIRVDYWIENGWTWSTGNQDYTYNTTLTLNGATQFSQTSLTHYQRARWHKVFWTTNPQLHAKHDFDYLMSTKAIPRYDLTYAPNSTTLNALRSSTSPMDNGDHSDNMGDTGFQQGIGPMCRWSAFMVTSQGDRRAHNAMMANNDGGLAYQIFHRDQSGAGAGYPVSIDNWPQGSSGDPPASTPSYNSGTTSNPHAADVYHQPLFGYLPYILTGDYGQLEHCQFWACWNLFWLSPGARNNSDGWWYTGSIRGMAWAYRTQAYAAWITPDSHPLKAYLTNKISTNLTRDIGLYGREGVGERTIFGTLESDGQEGLDEYRAWMDDFFTWAISNLIDLGYKGALGTEAQELFDYKAKMRIATMGVDTHQEFCYQLAPTYTLPFGTADHTPRDSPSAVYSAYAVGSEPNPKTTCGGSSMTTYLNSNYSSQAWVDGVFDDGQVIGQDSDGTTYFNNMQPVIAAMADHLHQSQGWKAWNRLTSAKGQAWPQYGLNPNFNIIPRTTQPATPAWYTALTANQWGAMPSPNVVTDVGASSTLVYPWSGAVLVTNGIWPLGGTSFIKGIFLVAWGTGHNDFPLDNGLYAYGPIDGATPQFYAITQKSNPQCQSPGSGLCSDGQPVSRHTYHGIAFLDAPFNRFFSGDVGSRGGDGFHDDNVNSYDLTKPFNVADPDGNWHVEPNNPSIANANSSVCVYDRARMTVWFKNSSTSQLYSYNPISESWQAFGPSVELPGGNHAGCIDTRNRRFLIYASGSLRYYNLDSPSTALATPGTSGDSLSGAGSITYDWESHMLYVWADSQKTIWSINPDTWVVTSITPAGGANPGRDPGISEGPGYQTGTYGRFQFVPSPTKGLLLYNSVSASPYFYKLT